MKRKSASPMAFYTICVAGLFLAGFFLLVVFGARTYRDIAAGQLQNNRARILLSYFTACAKANDMAGAVSVVQGENGPVLVIEDGGSGYAHRIYRLEGNLVEDFGLMESELDPEYAQIIGETEIFMVEELADGTYTVTTDAGRILFHARGEEEEDSGAGGR